MGTETWSLRPVPLSAAALCALVVLVATSCRPNRVAPTQPTSVAIGAAFTGAAALDETSRFVGLGPRVSGTPGAERAAAYLLERLTALGIPAAVDVFTDAAPAGSVVFRNVIARIGGAPARPTGGTNDVEALLGTPRPGAPLVVLVSHYDTKAGIPGFVGANDSGSSTGLLLALGQALARDRTNLPCEVLMVFVDGEECAVAYGPRDGLHGSRHMAARLRAAPAGGQVAAVLVLDMIGDRDLFIGIPANSTRPLVARVLDAAAHAGTRRHFGLTDANILDDHVPFIEAGFPAADLIDFCYGSAPNRNDYWHTPADTLDKLSAESLGAVGRTVLAFIEKQP